MSDSNWYTVDVKIKLLAEDDEYYKEIHHSDSAIHPLIANEIFSPIIKGLGKHMTVWRFHRWFEPSRNRHSLRFKFYGPDLSREISQRLQSYSLYQELKKERLLEVDDNEDISCGKAEGRHIRDDNEDWWPNAIKEAWPYYIHGVSRAWLTMIRESVKQEGKMSPHSSLKEKIHLYGRINKRIEDEWRDYGGCALLHHLNAIFGYKHTRIDGHILNSFLLWPQELDDKKGVGINGLLFIHCRGPGAGSL